MFLKCLYLSEDSFVAFEKGLNIILAENRKHESDEEERTSDTNGVGKSTIVNMIKFLLCGSTENYLDSNFFTDNNIWPILEVRAKGEPFVFAAPLSKSLKDKLYIVFEGTLEEFLEKWKRVDLGVIEKPKDAKDLFEGVESFSVLSKEEYKSYLSRIEKVNYADTNLKLSSLMDYVCRDEKLGFGDIVSRIGRTMWIQYRAIQYLFGLPYVLEEKSNNFREEISKIETNLKLKKEFLAERGIVNQDSLEVEKVKLNQQLEELKNQISSLDLTESNELTRKEYQKKKKELVRLNEEINYRERQMASQQANLEEIKDQDGFHRDDKQ